MTIEQRLALALRRRICQELANQRFERDVHNLLTGSIAPAKLAGAFELRGEHRLAHDLHLLEEVDLPATRGIYATSKGTRVDFGGEEDQ